MYSVAIRPAIPTAADRTTEGDADQDVASSPPRKADYGDATPEQVAEVLLRYRPARKRDRGEDR